jgi:hypothetical protein
MRQVYCEVTESSPVTSHSTSAIFIDHPKYRQVVAAAKERESTFFTKLNGLKKYCA